MHYSSFCCILFVYKMGDEVKIYIASKYIEHRILNRSLADFLLLNNFDPFLPAEINIDAVTKEEMQEVAEICYRKIAASDVMLVVTPFGISVSAEMGYAIAHNKITGKPRYIIGYGKPKQDEAMVIPYFDYIVEDFQELLDVLKSLEID